MERHKAFPVLHLCRGCLSGADREEGNEGNGDSTTHNESTGRHSTLPVPRHLHEQGILAVEVHSTNCFNLEEDEAVSMFMSTFIIFSILASWSSFSALSDICAATSSSNIIMVRKLFFGGLIFPLFLLKLSTYGFLWGRKLFFWAQKLSSRPFREESLPKFAQTFLSSLPRGKFWKGGRREGLREEVR